MANFLNKLPNTANSALTEAVTKQLPELNSVLETANTATSITNAIQGKPTLEDSVREALLQVIVNPIFSKQIESDIATVFKPILKQQLEKVGKIIAKADEAKTPEEAEAVKTDIETAIAEGSEGSVPVAEEGSVPVAEEGSNTEGSNTKGSNTEGSNTEESVKGGSKRKNRNKSRKSLKKSASRGRRTTRRHKRTSR